MAILSSFLVPASVVLFAASFYSPSAIVGGTTAGLSDFGGDVSQYLGLLRGTSAFSFSPDGGGGGGDDEEEGVDGDGGGEGFLGGLLRSGGATEEETEEEEDAAKDFLEGDLEDGAGAWTVARRSLLTDAAVSPAQDLGGPGGGDDEAPPPVASPTAKGTAMGDFGGDYGDYLRLLEDDAALGFNPQQDPIADNQDLQTDVFGGAMSGKYWKMYKGKSSYDGAKDLDAEEASAVGRMEEEEAGDSLRRRRHTPEVQEDDEPQYKEQRMVAGRPRGRPRSEHTKAKQMLQKWTPARRPQKKWHNLKKEAGGQEQKQSTLILTYKPKAMLASELPPSAEGPSGARLLNLSSSVMDQLGVSSAASAPDLLLLGEMLGGERTALSRRRAATAIAPHRARDDHATQQLRAFTKKFASNVPDPISTSKGLGTNFRNLTLSGLSDVWACDDASSARMDLSPAPPPSTSSRRHRASLCVPVLMAAVDTSSGPGVPFRGKVTTVLKRPKIKVTYRVKDDGGLHFLSARVSLTARAKFVPTYDSSIPLNPWSKVSMSGYMVSRVKKVLPQVLDKTILKLLHVVEKLD